MRFIPILMSLLLTGCVTYPEKVQVAEGTQLVSYQQERKATVNQSGRKARWSGVIANVKNLANKTQVDILFYPSKQSGRPEVKGEPIGRFRVYANSFLEPEFYKKGSQVTVLGTVTQKESEKIDEYEYLYPTLKDAVVHLWPERQPQQHAQVEFYSSWYGPQPMWYWHGGVRHLYIVGEGKKTPVAQKQKEKNKN